MAPNPILVRVPTTDGLLLDGALFEPLADKPKSRAWVFLHGTGSNFTSPGILEGLARLFASRGEAALRLNTRGHDFLVKIPTMSGSRIGGAAFDNIAEAHLDIEAATAWLVDAGYDNVSLLGHSMGGVKIITSQSQNPIAAVDELVALSPPRLRYENLIQDHAFKRGFDHARELVDSGRGEEFVEMTSPVKLWMPARGIVEKYGLEDRFDIVELLRNVKVATLVFIDTKSLESSAAHQGLESALTEVARSHSSLTVQHHPDDIRYSGSEVVIANQIAGWRTKRDAMMDAGI